MKLNSSTFNLVLRNSNIEILRGLLIEYADAIRVFCQLYQQSILMRDKLGKFLRLKFADENERSGFAEREIVLLARTCLIFVSV